MPRFSIIPWKKLKNQSKDGIWELRVLSTCSMNSQSLLYFSRINSLKNGKSGKIWHDKVGCIPLAGWILRNCPASLEFTKKMENLSKDGIRKLRVISTCSMNSQSLPCFFGINSSKNGKSGQKDWIWQRRIYSTYGMNSHNLPRFSRTHWNKNG